MYTKEKTSGFMRLIYSMMIIELGIGLITFGSRLMSHQKMLKLFAPQTGAYHWLYEHVASKLGIYFDLAGKKIGFASALIISVIIVRSLLSILSLCSMRSMRSYSLKRESVKPQLQLIDDALFDEPLDPMQVKALQQQKKLLLAANHIKFPWRWSAVTTIISLIFMTILYQVIAYDKALQNQIIWGIRFNSQNIWLTIGVAVLYFINEAIVLKRTKQPAYLMIISPTLIFISSFYLPAVISVYWTIGACISIVMNLVLLVIYSKISLKSKPVTIVTPDTINLITRKSTENEA